MQEFIKKQMLVGMGMLVLILVLAQLLDQDYRSAAMTATSFVFGWAGGMLLAHYRKRRSHE